MSAEDVGRARSFYDTVAVNYAQLLPDVSFEAPAELGVLDHFIDLLGTPAGVVLDAGCGTGRMISYLHERSVTRVAGVDLSPGMIDQARIAHPQIPLAVGELVALPYADGCFEGVLSWYSIIHTEPSECALVVAEFARVLEPGGHVLLGYQAGTGSRTIRNAYGHDATLRAYLYHTEYLGDALEAGGFDLVVTLDRAARSIERNAQGFLLARRR